jgi:hypothetical protein
MSGDVDDWHIGMIRSNQLLKVETTQIRKRYVQDQATRTNFRRARQEFFRRCKRLRLPSRKFDKQLELFAYGNIVVDDKDSRLLL